MTYLGPVRTETRPLRNQSGLTIPAHRLVAIVGYDSGTDRLLVDLADATDGNRRPAVAVTTEAVPNNTNFEGLKSGRLSGFDTGNIQFDTGPLGITDQLCVGTTGFFSRPPPEKLAFTGEVQLVGQIGQTGVSGELDVEIGPGLLPGYLASIDDSEGILMPTGPLNNNTGQIVLTTNLIGGCYTTPQARLFNRIILRVTAQAGAPTMSLQIFQKISGRGGTPAVRVATVQNFAVGATGTFILTPAEGLVQLDPGIFFVLYGRDSAAGSITLRTMQNINLDLLNQNNENDLSVFTFTTTLAANAAPSASINPLPVAGGGNATPVTTDILALLRVKRV